MFIMKNSCTVFRDCGVNLLVVGVFLVFLCEVWLSRLSRMLMEGDIAYGVPMASTSDPNVRNTGEISLLAP